MTGPIKQKLISFLDWITKKEDNDRMGHGINMALILSFGIISITSSIFILYSVFATTNELVLMQLLSRIILAGFFLVIGLGLLLFLRIRNNYNDEDEFWQTLKDTYVSLQREEKMLSLQTSQGRPLFEIEVEVVKAQT
jgi:hypothetical protein